MHSTKSYLEWPDFVIVVFVLVSCVALGFYFRYKKIRHDRGNDLKEFLLASGSLSVFPVAVSITATSFTAYVVTGVTGEMYVYGCQYFFNFLGIFVGILVGARYIVPLYRERQYLSVFEIVERRIDVATRRFLSTAFIIQKLLFLGLVLYLPALAMATLTNFNYKVTTIILGSICTFYSTIGGLRTIVWTDVIQAGFMFATIFMVAIRGIVEIGGISTLVSESMSNEFFTSIRLMEHSNTRHSVWANLIFGFLWSMDLLLMNQATVQRVQGARSASAAMWSVVVGGLLSLTFGVCVTITGAVVYIYYKDCDPMTISEYTGVKLNDQLFIYAIGDMFRDYPALKGIAISGIISASLSTFSSFVNSFAAVTLEDFVKPLFPRATKNEKTNLLICMILSFIYGVIITCGSFLIPLMNNVIRAMAIIKGIFGGPLLGVAFLVMFWNQMNKEACFGSFIIGTLFNTWIVIGNSIYVGKKTFEKIPKSIKGCDFQGFNKTVWQTLSNNRSSNATFTKSKFQKTIFHPLYNINFMWYPAIGFIVTFISGIMISVLISYCKSRKRSETLVHLTDNNRDPVEKETSEAMTNLL